MSSQSHYPDFALGERKDALVPQPQEFDFSDPDKEKSVRKSSCKSAESRLELFERMAGGVPAED